MVKEALGKASGVCLECADASGSVWVERELKVILEEQLLSVLKGFDVMVYRFNIEKKIKKKSFLL